MAPGGNKNGGVPTPSPRYRFLFALLFFLLMLWFAHSMKVHGFCRGGLDNYRHDKHF
jgi:hypothetical protein